MHRTVRDQLRMNHMREHSKVSVQEHSKVSVQEHSKGLVREHSKELVREHSKGLVLVRSKPVRSRSAREHSSSCGPSALHTNVRTASDG